MKRYIYILLIVCACSFSAMAQIALPNEVKVFLPECLRSNLIQEKDLSKVSKENRYGQSNIIGEKKFWNVYSDRSNNPAYKQPSTSSGVANMLKFNQKLRIAEIDYNKGFALVYEEPDRTVSHPTVSPDAKKSGALGWVPMDNLLLWNLCPADKHGILQKALLAYNINKANDGSSFKCYSNPVTKDGEKHIDSDVSFYYIMKRAENGLVLLAREAGIDEQRYQVLYGWVYESSYSPWNERSCLELNWKTNEIKEKLSGDSVGFFDNAKMIKTISNYYKFGLNDDTRVGREKRLSGNILRLPILENETGNNDIYHITYFASKNGGISYQEANKRQDKSKIELDQFINKARCMNLIIVIDGTESMQPYFKPAYRAIKNACDKYAHTNYDVKLGLVIYRDYKDVKNGKSYCVEHFPVKPLKDTELYNAFATGGEYGIKSAPHDDYPEALYEGLYTALDTTKMKYSKEENNLLIVVGDCGDRGDDPRSPTFEQILEKCDANSVNIVSFQVYYKEVENSDAWYNYDDQMYNMILENVRKNYEKTNLNGEFVDSEDGKGYDYKVNVERAFYVASTRRPSLGDSLKVRELEELINDKIYSFTSSIEDQINAASNVYTNYNSIVATGNQSYDTAFVKSKLSKEAWENLKLRNSLVAIDGYTPKKNSRGGNYFKPVLFIEKGEFEKLITQFSKVYDASRNGHDDRDAYINAMKQLLITLVPDMTLEELNKEGTARIMMTIAGLNEKPEGIENHRFEDLGNENVVSRSKFHTIVEEFKNKFRALQTIYEKRYDYIFKSNNKTYYWIPFDQLP